MNEHQHQHQHQIRKNEVASLEELRHLQGLSKLRSLWLSHNPCATGADYRLRVVRMLPQLTKLDNADISDAERQSAAELGESCTETAQQQPAPQPQPPASARAARESTTASTATASMPASARGARPSRASSAGGAGQGSKRAVWHLAAADKLQFEPMQEQPRHAEAPAAAAQATPSPVVVASPAAAVASVAPQNPEGGSKRRPRPVSARSAGRSSPSAVIPVLQPPPQQPPSRPASASSSNILRAVMALLSELDDTALQVVRSEVDTRLLLSTRQQEQQRLMFLQQQQQQQRHHSTSSRQRRADVIVEDDSFGEDGEEDDADESLRL